MNSCQKFFSTSVLALFASAAFAADAPPLDTAGDFAVLSATAGVGGAVSMTGSSITGNVGSSGAVSLTDTTITGNVALNGALANTRSTFSGTSALDFRVVTDFDEAYTALSQTCTNNITTAAFPGVPLSVGSGVTCFTATTGVTFTNSVLTLTGNGPWILRVVSPTGALTGTSMTVVMASGGDACDVFWQVNAATTLTTSVFRGTILAGAGITTTGGTVAGRLLAKAAVEMTGTTVIGCDSALPGTTACKPHKHHKHKHKKGHDRDDDDDDGDHHHDNDDDDDDDDRGHGNGKSPWWGWGSKK